GPLSVTERHGAGASKSTAYDDAGAGRTSEAAHGHGTGDEADSHRHTSRQDGGSKDGVAHHDSSPPYSVTTTLRPRRPSETRRRTGRPRHLARRQPVRAHPRTGART